jgi:hypothetical protein
LWWGFFMLGVLIGCGDEGASTGGSSGEDESAAEQPGDEKRTKVPYAVEPPVPLLSEAIVDMETGQSVRCAKPGHWTSTVQTMTANYDDLEGQNVLSVVESRQSETPPPLAHTAYRVVASRPALLAKGRPKRVESEVYLPEELEDPAVASRVINQSNGRVAGETPATVFPSMPSFQYFLVVLAREPSRYGFLKVIDSIRAPWEAIEGSEHLHYRVVLADGQQRLPLPPSAMAWTSVAYVIWDEVNLDRIDPDQQRAILDWIHWGGRLIINGPDSWDSLRSSFLADYLPVTVGGSLPVTGESLAAFNAAWSRTGNGRALDPLRPVGSFSRLEMTPRDRNRDRPIANSEPFFFQRDVGLGSVVISAIQLAEPDLINWPGFDAFFNNAILGRPPRRFDVEREGSWSGLQCDWADYQNRSRDAYFTTPLRWFSRDAGTAANVIANPPGPAGGPGVPGGAPGAPPPGVASGPELETVQRPGGLGAWNEFSPLASAARNSLLEAAGVRVPAASFVVACLAAYLIVLVPLNWMVFHALQRVEWAWIAAPLIAIAGTVSVVHLAQLDIGFVSARTEVALLETFTDYPRGHLTRFSALYTSLASNYDLEFDDPSAVATPFPRDEEFAVRTGDSVYTASFEKYDRPRLRNLAIASASTLMVHSEQMLPLAGAIRLTTSSRGGLQIDNQSGLDLTDAAVVRRRFDDQGTIHYDGCWIGDLRSGSIQGLPLRAINWPAKTLPFEKERQRSGLRRDTARLDLEPVLKGVFEFPDEHDPLHGRRDETRLVARYDQLLPGAAAEPEPSQGTGAVVVLAHLEVGPGADPAPDMNHPRQVAPDRGRRLPPDDEFSQ